MLEVIDAGTIQALPEKRVFDDRLLKDAKDPSNIDTSIHHTYTKTTTQLPSTTRLSQEV
jgi:hypothetical protein